MKGWGLLVVQYRWEWEEEGGDKTTDNCNMFLLL